MMPPPRSKAVTAGLAAAVVITIICLVFALWNPIAALLPTIILIVVTVGILKHRRWSAYGGALFVVSIAAAAVIALARLGVQGRTWASVAMGAALFGVGAWLLFRAGRNLPALASVASRRIWIALAVVVFLSPQLMHAFVISGGSMENTLLVGDQVLVTPLAGTPERGELVTFRYLVDPNLMFVKRVVAVGGDRVRIEDKRLIVNEMPVAEPYVVHSTSYVDAFRDNFPSQPNTALPISNWEQELKQDTVNGELIVPRDKFFVLGDNRDNSLDSRYWGFLSAEDLIGRPLMIFFSQEATPSQLINGPFSAPPALMHPSTIRWSRMFRTL
jgi:signal peptidase I